MPFVSLPTPGTPISDELVLEREIGSGAVGVVFQAKDRQGRSVAIKMITPQSMGMPGVVERFHRETGLAAALTSRHTIQIFGTGIYGQTATLEGLPYMVMEYLEGETLEALVQREGALPQDRAIHILLEILASLSEAHEKGVVHRDLKPENVFLCQQGGDQVVRVLDFGIAKAVRGDWGTLSEKLTMAGMMLGTPLYMAPEQTTGKAVITPALDVYAASCIAHWMLVGRPPFVGHNPFDIALRHLKEPVPSLAAYASPALATVLEKSMAKEPSERYPDARAMARALRSAWEADADDEATATLTVAELSQITQADSIDQEDDEPTVTFTEADTFTDSSEDATLAWKRDAIVELTAQRERSQLIPVGRRRGLGSGDQFVEAELTKPAPDQPVDLSELASMLWAAQPSLDGALDGVEDPPTIDTRHQSADFSSSSITYDEGNPPDFVGEVDFGLSGDEVEELIDSFDPESSSGRAGGSPSAVDPADQVTTAPHEKQKREPDEPLPPRKSSASDWDLGSIQPSALPETTSDPPPPSRLLLIGLGLAVAGILLMLAAISILLVASL